MPISAPKGLNGMLALRPNSGSTRRFVPSSSRAVPRRSQRTTGTGGDNSSGTAGTGGKATPDGGAPDSGADVLDPDLAIKL
jgi:hypothetical protein